MKYNVLKRVFNLISAILGIIFASFYIIMAVAFAVWALTIKSTNIVYYDEYSYSYSSTGIGTAERLIFFLVAVVVLVFAILFVVVSSKLCFKAKIQEDGTFDNRNKKNAGFIVFMILSGAFFYGAYALSVAAQGGNTGNINVIYAIIINTIILMALHITYMALPSAVKVYAVPQSAAQFGSTRPDFGADEFSVYFSFANDLKTLLYEKTINEKEFDSAFDALTKGFTEALATSGN